MRRTQLALSITLAVSLATGTPAAATERGSWDHVGNGGAVGTPSLNAIVSVLHKVGTELYAGGSFTNASGDPNADRIAKWDGIAWRALGTKPLDSGAVLAIAHYGGKIYVGGNFQNAGGNPDADNLAVFDGTNWAPFCASAGHVGSVVSLQVNALQVIGSTLYVGGDFQNGTGLAKADYLLACDLVTGAPRATVDTDGDFTGAVYALTADSNGVLYAGGTFTNLDGDLAADHIAAYDGTWHAVGGGIDTFVRALTAKGTNVYVGTDKVNVAGIAKADHVVKWDGSAWQALGGNTAGTDGWFPTTTYIYSLAASGSLLFAAGSFQNANGQTAADNVAWFDGRRWHPLGSNGAGDGPWVGEGRALEAVNGLVYAGGNFTSAGGDINARFVASRSLRLPDAAIRTIPGTFVGNDIYSLKALASQTATMQIERGSSRSYQVLIQNDGLVPAAFTVRSDYTTEYPGYTVMFSNDANAADITAELAGGNFSTGILAPGKSFSMRMIVQLSLSAANIGTFQIRVKSPLGTPIYDTVRGVVSAF